MGGVTVNNLVLEKCGILMVLDISTFQRCGFVSFLQRKVSLNVLWTAFASPFMSIFRNMV